MTRLALVLLISCMGALAGSHDSPGRPRNASRDQANSVAQVQASIRKSLSLTQDRILEPEALRHLESISDRLHRLLREIPSENPVHEPALQYTGFLGRLLAGIPVKDDRYHPESGEMETFTWTPLGKPPNHRMVCFSETDRIDHRGALRQVNRALAEMEGFLDQYQGWSGAFALTFYGRLRGEENRLLHQKAREMENALNSLVTAAKNLKRLGDPEGAKSVATAFYSYHAAIAQRFGTADSDSMKHLAVTAASVGIPGSAGSLPPKAALRLLRAWASALPAALLFEGGLQTAQRMDGTIPSYSVTRMADSILSAQVTSPVLVSNYVTAGVGTFFGVRTGMEGVKHAAEGKTWQGLFETAASVGALIGVRRHIEKTLAKPAESTAGSHKDPSLLSPSEHPEFSAEAALLEQQAPGLKLPHSSNAGGGFGEVFFGWLNGRKVAVKRVINNEGTGTHPEALAQHEFKMLQLAEKHGVPAPRPIAQAGSTLVMEFKEGRTLASWLESVPSPSARFQMAKQVLALQQKLSDAGLRHNDLKPQNLIVGPEGQLALIDFGLSVPKNSRPAVTGVVGTPGYLPHEIMSQTKDLGAKTLSPDLVDSIDPYAFSRILSEVLGARGEPAAKLIFPSGWRVSVQRPPKNPNLKDLFGGLPPLPPSITSRLVALAEKGDGQGFSALAAKGIEASPLTRDLQIAYRLGYCRGLPLSLQFHLKMNANAKNIVKVPVESGTEALVSYKDLPIAQ